MCPNFDELFGGVGYMTSSSWWSKLRCRFRNSL